jgi:hypothetical protein
MEKYITLSIALLFLLLTLAGCAGDGAIAGLQYDGHNNNTSKIDGEELDENTSEVRWAAVPAVFVNDTYFRVFTADEQQHIVPQIDDTWVYLGDIQSNVPGWQSPTQNYQTNNERMLGAEIYYSSEGRIPVTNSAWGDPLEEEVVGVSIIVVFEDLRLLYISEEAHDELIEVMNTIMRPSLMVDGVMYSLMATAGGGDFSLSDNHIFLGEIASATPMDEYPTENLQSNRDIVIGAKVYRLPSGESNDIVVFFNSDERFYFSNLP